MYDFIHIIYLYTDVVYCKDLYIMLILNYEKDIFDHSTYSNKFIYR